MKTKQQKTEELNLGAELLDKNRILVFANFNKVDVDSINKFKSELKKSGSIFKVMKKRLFKIALKKKGIDFGVPESNSQFGVIFIPGELSDAAGIIYKFSKDLSKEGKEFKTLGAYEVIDKNFLDAEQFLVIAKLPSREILLAQVIGAISGPLKAFMHIVNEISRKGGSKKTSEQNQDSEKVVDS